jgi:Zn finger protein HypA/HybF involved in hydrogenase expression
MIIEEQAKIIGAVTEVATKVEIYCPNCGRDVDETELSAKKCNDCGTDLSQPEQHVAVAVTSVPAFAITF